MRSIAMTKFCASTSEEIYDIAGLGEPFLLTRHGKAVATLVLVDNVEQPHLTGIDTVKRNMLILGDIGSPIGTDLWEALK